MSIDDRLQHPHTVVRSDMHRRNPHDDRPIRIAPCRPIQDSSDRAWCPTTFRDIRDRRTSSVVDVINTQSTRRTVKNLNFELSTLCRRNRDGSYSTRHRRHESLQRIATRLHELGFRHMRATSLRNKHVVALVEAWREEGLSAASMQNYMAHVRWWAEKIGRAHWLLPTNAHYGIGHRDHSFQNKAQRLTEAEFKAIEDDYVRASVRLQQAFGLRREESIKFRPSYADLGDRIRLKGSWTKGGRPREIPILDSAQRALIDSVRELVGTGSLIPPHLLYKHQMNRYDRATRAAGHFNLHGLRHGYAQRRYEQLTGWPSPAAGGPSQNELKPSDFELDQRCRLIVSRELGHNRIEITKVYLG